MYYNTWWSLLLLLCLSSVHPFFFVAIRSVQTHWKWKSCLSRIKINGHGDKENRWLSNESSRRTTSESIIMLFRVWALRVCVSLIKLEFLRLTWQSSRMEWRHGKSLFPLLVEAAAFVQKNCYGDSLVSSLYIYMKYVYLDRTCRSCHDIPKRLTHAPKPFSMFKQDTNSNIVNPSRNSIYHHWVSHKW